MMKNKILFILFGFIVVIGPIAVGGWFLLGASPEDLPPIVTATTSPPAPLPAWPAGRLSKERGERNVPFTSQAPSGGWDNVVFQQGCEEASIVMAMLWVEGKQILNSEAEKEILAISSFEQENYGEFRDTSAEDTAKVMRDYFDYENIEVKSNVAAEDIKAELASGNLVIVPVNGQKMGNPFYTPPGPIQHMVVVRGYDTKTKEFITNDPGTRRGEAFRYPEDVLGQALQDYETGYKEPIGELRKAMIVVSPQRSDS